MLKPLIYGYLQVTDDLHDHELRATERDLNSGPKTAGFCYATTFHEDQPGHHGGFDELTRELQRAQAHDVVVPSVEHLSAPDAAHRPAHPPVPGRARVCLDGGAAVTDDPTSGHTSPTGEHQPEKHAWWPLSRPAPVGWAYLEDGFTIRWRRGDTVAHVFSGEQLWADPATTPAVATIPVMQEGWTDHTQIRGLGERWIRERTRRPGMPKLADQLRAVLSSGNPTDEQIRRIVARSASSS